MEKPNLEKKKLARCCKSTALEAPNQQKKKRRRTNTNRRERREQRSKEEENKEEMGECLPPHSPLGLFPFCPSLMHTHIYTTVFT